MIKKIRIEIVVIGLLLLNILIASNLENDIYKKFNGVDFNLGNIFLKEFFTNITELGNSLWFFFISIIGYLICFLFEKIRLNKFFTKIKVSFLVLFVSLFVTGTITHIIKHLVGRPRPRYADQSDSFGINFFNTESAFHSFPSGHTSTIFIVALVFSLLTPRLKYLYFFFAFVVGFSRVAVGAHYFSDVLAGIAVAFIGLKITLWLFSKYLNKKNLVNNIQTETNLFFLNIIVFLITIVFLTIGSSLDIFISSLFYEGNNVFILQAYNYLSILSRKVFLPFVILYVLVFPILSLYFPINKIYFGFSFNLKKILFLWGSSLINVIIIINFFLKGFWGRARPNEVVELGGKEYFTPWYKITDACISNCSFVSGDASVGFSLIALFFLTNNKNFYWIALCSGLFLGIIRISEGGHFLSDVIIAGFIVFILTYIQWKFFEKKFKNEL